MLDSLEIWHSALGEATARPVRVVVVADSMGELSFGYQKVWSAFHDLKTLCERGVWSPPRAMDGEFAWPLLPGEPAEIGIEARGQLLREEDGPAGIDSEVAVSSTVDLYYTARPDGAPVEVVVDGHAVLRVDTSRDELGSPVVGPVMCQRGRSPRVSGAVNWQIRVVGPGVAAVEAVCLPPVAGLEVHGTGRSGVPTREQLEAGYALAHIEAMVTRGEAPDLVVWACDTSDQSRVLDLSPLERALDETRRIAPGAAIAHYVPTGHNDRADWAEWAEAFREVDRRRGVIVLDGFEALGDVSRSGASAHLSKDGAHLNPEGQAVMDRAWIDTLMPADATELRLSTTWEEALAAAAERPARVVVVSDGAGELSAGFGEVWRHFHDRTGGTSGWWSAPGSARAGHLDLLAGEVSEIGLDGAGRLLKAGDGPVGTTTPVAVPTTLDIYYTARPDGAPLVVRIDGAPDATLDTSTDEHGAPVSEPVGGQLWRSAPVGGMARVQVEAVGPGTAAVEALCAPPASGVEVHGTGRWGRSTSDVIESGHALAHIEAMVRRGEAPALVVWAADSSSSPDGAAAVSATNLALLRTRSLLPAATIASYVPPVVEDRPDWPLRAAFLRMVAANNSVVVLDGEEALGDISSGSPGEGLSTDGRHLTPRGQAVIDRVFIEVLSPG